MLFDHRGDPIKTDDVPLGEIASAGRDDITAPWVGDLVAVQDDILKGKPGGIKSYSKLLDDDQVKSTLQQRYDAVLEKEYEVIPGGTSADDIRAAEYWEEVLKHVKWDSAYEKMLYGTFYGYAVAELLHARDGQLIYPDEIRVRDRSRFRFGLMLDEERRKSVYKLRLLTRDNPQGEVMPDRKFWWYGTGGDHDDNPYGLGLAHYLYWPVYLKRNWTKSWLIFGEKFAAPTPIGHFPVGTKKEEQTRLLQALSALTTDGAIALPEGFNVDKFEALRTGTGTYEPFYDKMNEAISKINLSQTMTTDNGSSRSQAEVHQGVGESVSKSDDRFVSESFSRHPMRWYTEWNFPGAVPPTVRRKFEDEEDLDTIAARDQKIYITGYQRTEESVKDVYGEGYERRTPSTGLRLVPASEDGQDATFAEADIDATVRALTSQAGALMFDGLLAPVKQLLDGAASLEEVRDQIASIYGEMDADRLGMMLMRARVAADLAGRYEVQEGE